MSVNFYSNNGLAQYPQLQKDIHDVKGKVRHIETLDKEVGKSLLESIPMFRRMASVPEKLENGEIVSAVGTIGVAAAMVTSDMEDINDAIAHGKGILGIDKYTRDYDHRATQHEFAFIKGSLIEKLGEKTNNRTIKQGIYTLSKSDKSIESTRFGQRIKKFFNVTDGAEVPTEIKDCFGDKITLNEIKAKSLFGELTGRALKRTTILGLCALGILELPKIFNSMGEGKSITEQSQNTVKQTAKSGINVATIAAGISYGGAIGSKYGGAIGSLVGMGAGAVFGSLASEKIQDCIN